MSTTKTRFSDQRYLNWLKDTLSLLYVKEALENIIDTDAVQFHQYLQRSLCVNAAATTFCFNCTQNDINKDVRRQVWWMKCSLCDSWLQQIVQNHADQPLPNLHRENTDPQLWPTSPYEVFKCYMPHGCKSDKSAKDSDAQSMLSLLYNCDYFRARGRIGRLGLVDQLLRIRNSLFHSGKFFVDAIDLQMDMQTMLDFLRGLKSLSDEEDESVKKAIDNIEELQANKVDLSLNRELELQALQQQQIALKKDLSTYNAKLTAVHSDVKSLQTDVTSTATKGAAADIVLKTIQTDIDKHRTKLKTVEAEVKTFQEDVTTATSKSSAAELDVKALTETTKGLELRMKKLQGVQDSFNIFLQANDLEQDMSKLSKTIEKHEEKIKSLEEQTQTHFQAQSSELESCKRKLSDHEERLTSKQLKVCSEAVDVTDTDITVLQKCLIDYYKTMCLTVPNPVEDDDVGLSRVYVDPQIKVLRDTTDPSCGLKKVENQATSLSHCRRLFRTKDYRCKQIYLTGDAGSGKSMHCRHLLSLWCEAHDKTINASSSKDSSDNSTSRLETSRLQEDEERKPGQQEGQLKEEDREIMSEFTLLFFVSLRDASDKYHIEDIIDSEILQQIDDMQIFKASILLKKVCCLIILDGLDEWVPPTNAKPLRFLNPGIPGRNRLNKGNVFLTTTRPWKLDVLFLKSSDIDKHVQLVGFDRVASKTLYSHLIHLLNKTGEFHNFKSFWAELKKKGLDHLHSVPVILTQLICLWLDDQDLGQSQVQLYCSMLEMLLKRSDKNQSDQTCACVPNIERSEGSLPDCLLEHPYCQAHQQLLVSLNRVAFQALFNQERERSLVFKSSQMAIFGVDKQHIDLCLKSGILSQNKVLGKRSVSEKKMTFLHKKLQEFLAAVFITNSASAENVISHVKSFCGSVETVLEMSQVWMFVSGIRPDISLQLLTDLMTRIVYNNKSVQQSRQSLSDPYAFTCIQRSIQTCLVDCVSEARSNGHGDFWLSLEDFVIDKDTTSECLNSLLTSNNATVKSVYITTGHVDDVDHPLLTAEDIDRTLRQLQNTHCLKKLYLSDGRDVISKTTLRETIEKHSSNLTSLVLHHITFNPKLSAAVCDTLKQLSALGLTRITLRHEQRQRLLSCVAQAATLRELKLSLLICTDHGRSCDPIDITSLTQLHIVDLQHMYIDKLPVANCAERVALWDVTIPESQLRQFVRELSSATHKVMVELDNVTVTSDSGNRVDFTYLRHHDKLVVTQWKDNENEYGDSDDIFSDSPTTCTLSIHFHTQQQNTSEEGNQTQTCTPLQ